MKYDLAIFDLDGTILNTLDDLADSINVVCKKHGFPEHATEEIKYMVGNGIPKLIERAVPAGISEEKKQQVFKDFVAYYDLHRADKTSPYEGMLELLRKLKTAGVKLAVNTNKLHEASVPLCNQYFPEMFDCVCGNRHELGVKPCPDGVFFIMNQLGFNKEKCSAVYIGDSDVDVLTAKNAGIDFIGCDWGFRGKDFLLEHGAEITVSEPEKLQKFILEY